MQVSFATSPAFSPARSALASGVSQLRRTLPLAAALIGYAIFLFAPQVLNDGDTWWQIAAGQWILRHGAVPHTDPFSYTFAGAPWTAHEWLSELLSALAFRAGGWDGLLMLYGAAAALAFGLLAVHLARWADGLCLVLLLLLGLACTAGSLLVRPHLLALPVLEAWTAGLLIARSRNAAPSLWLLPLMVLWANLHGSFILGLALPLPFALEAVIATAGRDRGRVVRSWAVFIAGAFAAALATPQFWHGLVFPFRLIRMHDLAAVTEWRPTDFSHLQPLEIALMVLLYATWSRGIRLPVLRLLLLLGLLHLALAHGRHQMLAGVIGALLLAEPLGRAFGGSSVVDPRRRGFAPGTGWVAAGLAMALVLTGLRLAYPAARHNDAVSPVAALDRVPAAIRRTPVFNAYDFGGYLIFRGIAPFIDGRTDLYGDRFMSAYLHAAHGDMAAFQRIVATYHVHWALLHPTSPLALSLAGLPGWRRVYADRFAVAFVRRRQAARHEAGAAE